MQPNEHHRIDADIIIVGAGLAGVTAAAVLGRRWRVILIDPRATCPPVFKAEKIEPEQAEFLRNLGLFAQLLPHVHPIREIKSYDRGRLIRVVPTEQYGARYSVMVDAIRAALPTKVQFRVGRVFRISNTAECQHVKLHTGDALTCRLVVLACGPNAEVLQCLGLRRIWVQKHQSLAVAFSIVPKDNGPFPFDALTYAIRSSRSGIDYVSFFPIEQVERANLFAFPAKDASWVQRLLCDPQRELARCLPALPEIAGEYKISGKVETAQIHLYRTEEVAQPGIVLIRDASQNVCPSTGIGLSKIFTDVTVLAEYVPHWFETDAIGSDKTNKFLTDPRKMAIDNKALQTAAYRRNACLAKSLKWRVHRTRLRVSVLLGRAKKTDSRIHSSA